MMKTILRASLLFLWVVLATGCIAPRIPRSLAARDGPGRTTVLMPVVPDDVSPPARPAAATEKRKQRDRESLAIRVNKVFDSMASRRNRLVGPSEVSRLSAVRVEELDFLWAAPAHQLFTDDQFRALELVGERLGCERLVLSRLSISNAPESNWVGEGKEQTVFVDLQLWNLNPPRQLARTSLKDQGWIVVGGGGGYGGFAIWVVGETSSRTLDRTIRQALAKLFLLEASGGQTAIPDR